MMEELEVNVKVEDDIFTLIDANPEMTFKTLKYFLYREYEIQPRKMRLYYDMPFKPVKYRDDSVKLFDVINSGDTLILLLKDIEIDQEVPEIEPPDTSEEPNKEISQLVLQLALFNRLGAHPGDGILKRYGTPLNSSSLFRCMDFIITKGQGNPRRSVNLRRLVADTIREDPGKYTYEYLGREPNEYIAWILNPNEGHGGALELYIFAETFHLEICAIDIYKCPNPKLALHKVTDDSFRRRCVIVYTGVYFDPTFIVQDGRVETMFSVNDDRPIMMALDIARQAHSHSQLTDFTGIDYQCATCELGLRDEDAAIKHTRSWLRGHDQFTNLKTSESAVFL